MEVLAGAEMVCVTFADSAMFNVEFCLSDLSKI
jgi:hypothetical protein